MAFFEIFMVDDYNQLIPVFAYSKITYVQQPTRLGHDLDRISNVKLKMGINQISELEFDLYPGHNIYSTIKPMQTRLFVTGGVAPFHFIKDSVTFKVIGAHGIPFVVQSVTEDIDGVKHVYAPDLLYGTNSTCLSMYDAEAKCDMSPRAVINDVLGKGWNLGGWTVQPEIIEEHGIYSRVDRGTYNPLLIGKNFNELITEARESLGMHVRHMMSIDVALPTIVSYTVEYQPRESFFRNERRVSIGEDILNYEEKNSLEDICTKVTAYCGNDEAITAIAEYENESASELYGRIHKVIKFDGELTQSQLLDEARKYVDRHLSQTVELNIDVFDDMKAIGLYDLITVESRSRYLNKYYISSIDYDLIDFQNTKVGLTLISSIYNVRNNLLTDSDKDNMLMVNYTEALEFIDIGG